MVFSMSGSFLVFLLLFIVKPLTGVINSVIFSREKMYSLKIIIQTHLINLLIAFTYIYLMIILWKNIVWEGEIQLIYDVILTGTIWLTWEIFLRTILINLMPIGKDKKTSVCLGSFVFFISVWLIILQFYQYWFMIFFIFIILLLFFGKVFSGNWHETIQMSFDKQIFFRLLYTKPIGIVGLYLLFYKFLTNGNRIRLYSENEIFLFMVLGYFAVDIWLYYVYDWYFSDRG